MAQIFIWKQIPHSLDKCIDYFFFEYLLLLRDQRLHKLVFEEDGLPDGTEVAYFARGQVVKADHACLSV